MPRIGRTGNAAVVRTDFSSEACWLAVREEMLAESDEGFRAYVEIIEGDAFDGCDVDQVLASAGDAYTEYGYSFVIIADRQTMTDAEHALLVVDRFDEPGRSFRVLPREVQAVENNLSIANMSFFEFADVADQNGGVFRGFS